MAKVGKRLRVGAAAGLLSCLWLGACSVQTEIPEVIVGGLDYTFDLPVTLSPGPIKVGFENRGEVRHELILARLRPGVLLVDLIAGIEEGEDPDEFTDGIGGILIAEPGETALGRLYVELESGRSYVMVCTFVDEEGAPPHFALGMIRSFSVE